MSERLEEGAEAWPLRPWAMAGIGAAAGFAFHFLTDHQYDQSLAAWRQALATFVGISAVAFVITVERRRWLWAVAFAVAWGAVVAFVGWFTAQYNIDATIFEWPYLSGIFAVMLAAPLFQTVRDQGRWSLPYERLHNHAWADAVIGAAGLFFTGVVFLLAWLIAGLFDLIGIEEIRKLLEKGWVSWPLAGFAFGAAVGLLRERDRLLPLLQRLVRIVLAVLAPPLAIALVLFLASIPFTGLEKFWKSGVPATPLLLTAGAGAILLANTVFADGPANRSSNRLLRWSSLLLVVVVLPLAGIAALSIGIRVSQYGWTPERMWGVIAVLVAIAYGAAGWYTIARSRLEFDEPLRPLQTGLAVAVCGVALFLALPILDFGAISASSQLSRLESGNVTPAKFDWKAMAFEFGPAGRARLTQIAQSGASPLRTMAAAALKAKDRWDANADQLAAGPPPVDIMVYPSGSLVPPELRNLLLHGTTSKDRFCSDGGACRVYVQPGGVFVAVMDGCANLPPAAWDDPTINCTRSVGVYEQQGGKWIEVSDSDFSAVMRGRWVKSTPQDVAELKREREALEKGDIHIAPVQMRQLVVGGKPDGSAF